MYFWKINALKATLRQRDLTERETLPYLGAFVVLPLLIMVPYQRPAAETWEYVFWGANILMFLAFLPWLYRANGGATGRQFAQRFLCVGWVLGLRWTVQVFLPFLILQMILMTALDRLPPNDPKALWLLPLAIELIWYWRFGVHLKDLARSDALRATQSEEPAENPASAFPPGLS